MDRSVGKHHVPKALRQLGAEVHLLDDSFHQTTPDDEWLAYAGQRGWIVITKDDNIRRHRVELNALIRNQVRAFVLADPQQTGQEMAATITQAYPRLTSGVQRL